MIWLAILESFLAGLIKITSKIALQQVPVLFVALLQTGATWAGFSMLAFGKEELKKLSAKVVLLSALSGVLAFVAANLLNLYALRHIPAVIVAPLSSTTILFSALLGVLFLRERLRAAQVVAILIMFAGVIAVAGGLAD